MPDQSYPWRDESVMRRLYIDERMTQYEIADELGCTQQTVWTWMNKHGIEQRRPGDTQAADPRLTDAEWVRREYKEKRRTSYDIAQELDCSRQAVLRWVHYHDIKPHSQAIHKFTIHPTFDMDLRYGYERVTSQNYEGSELVSSDRVTIHRLLGTLLVDDIGELDGMHIHHKNGIPWDNRLSNLEVVTPSEHRKAHAEN